MTKTMKGNYKHVTKITGLLNKHLILIGITLFALAIRLYFFKNTQAESVQDCYWLAKLAERILHGEYTIAGVFYGAVQPLYPFLMGILSLVTNDFFLSGKIISIVAGTATIPIIYLLWGKLESRGVALLAAWLVAVNMTAWYHSIHVFRDALFLFLCTLSFFLLFKARENFKWLPVLAFVLGLATLTRGEGYVLTISLVLAFSYWKRGYISGKAKLTKQRLRYILFFVIIYIAVICPWVLYQSVVIQEFISIREKTTHFNGWMNRRTDHRYTS
jgi:4-amino-4-deoxy-L-arabinose transferase-like glycosyltransferase